jgi:hypothetical protein
MLSHFYNVVRSHGARRRRLQHHARQNFIAHRLALHRIDAVCTAGVDVYVAFL